MRAVVINEIKNRAAVKIADLPSPTPGPGEVLIDVKACGINYTDYLSLDGRYQNNPPPPFTPGKDAAGIVSSCGEGVKGLSVGDRVIAHVTYGGLAEQVVCSVNRCFVIPPEIDFDAAAALGLVYQTAYFALKVRGQLREGEVVLINGASGGVGLACVALAKAMGARRVLAGLSTPSKADAVLKAGADSIVDLSGGELGNALRSQVTEQNEGQLADVVVDLLGGEYFDAGLRAVATYGRIVVTGFASGTIPTVRTNYLLLKNISIVGMTLQTFLDEEVSELRTAQSLVFDLLKAGKIDPHITSRFEFDKFMSAIELLESRKIVGKAVVVM